MIIHAKINTKVQDIAQDTYYFLINFLILALLLAGELSTLTRSFNNPTIIPITLFTLLQSNLGFSLTVDFVRLIWYLLPLVKYIPSGVYMIKCHSVPVVTIPYSRNSHSRMLDPQSVSFYLSEMRFRAVLDSKR